LFIGVPPPRRPVSIICVINDAPVREQCLDRSMERHRSEVDDLDYVLVDNRDGAFQSAGAPHPLEHEPVAQLSPRGRLLATDRAERGAGGGTAAFDEVDALRHGERNTA